MLLGFAAAVFAAAAAAGIWATSGSGAPNQEEYRVAVLTTGATNNRSWANAWSDGAKKAAREFPNVKVTIVGNLDAPDQYVSQGAAFASQGYDLLIFAHGAMVEPAIRLGRQFPNTKIVQVFQYKTLAEQRSQEPPNVGHVDIEQQHGAFLAGVLAGMLTKTNTIATVFAFPFPALTRQPEAFELGARCVNSKVKTVQKQTNSFTDAALARAAASSLISGGADVVFSAVDQAVQGIVQAAAQARRGKVYAIPSYYDSFALNPRVVLTSVLYNLQGVSYDLIKRGRSGQLGDHFFRSYTYRNLGVGELAKFRNPVAGEIPAVAVDVLNDIRTKLRSGAIRIPDETTGTVTIGTPGSAKKINVASLGCKPIK
jgi:basic membrane lipoprotein Med (substrate-binding protein (PBP1-ABC) superfamily)